MPSFLSCVRFDDPESFDAGGMQLRYSARPSSFSSHQLSMLLFWLTLLAVMTRLKASAVDNSRIDTNSKAVSDAMSADYFRESFERAMMEQKSTRIHITGRHNIVNSES